MSVADTHRLGSLLIAYSDEERHLVSFFGQEYHDYRERVPVRIPFIR